MSEYRTAREEYIARLLSAHLDPIATYNHAKSTVVYEGVEKPMGNRHE